MASVSYSDGRATVQFLDVDGKRRSTRLGAVPKRTAEAVKLRIEALLNAKITNTPVDRDTAAWLAGIGTDLAYKLAAVGLIEERDCSTLGDFTASYINRRTDVEPQTRTNFSIGRRRLIDFFGADRPLRRITPGDADAWLCWLKENYAEATAGKSVKWAKQFFRAAVRSKLIPSNPFDDVKPPSMANEARKRFIDRPTIDRVIQACPDAEWRLIVALCRYGGIRCPSELLPLQWAEVNWERDRFLVHSPKTGDRWVPIFAELRPYLADVFEQAEPGTMYVINRRRGTGQALVSQFKKICRRAGVTLWVKPFHNLRASRETELAASFPLHVVCAWIGNSAVIAQKHYLQVTDWDYQKAAGSAAKSGAVDREALQNPVQSALGRDGQELTQPTAPSEVSHPLSPQVIMCQGVTVTPRGFEPLSRP
jgi:integrase